ncbi:MAG TPA: DUF5522 domain-containing protein [Chitinophagales bacterium]|nr:DUF5522 domain-containing protein [Chitinophagales bacterium]
MENKLVENIDYNLDDLGRMVFTKEYHLKRGYCCGNNCINCPWKNCIIEHEIDKKNETPTNSFKSKIN